MATTPTPRKSAQLPSSGQVVSADEVHPTGQKCPPPPGDGGDDKSDDKDDAGDPDDGLGGYKKEGKPGVHIFVILPNRIYI